MQVDMNQKMPNYKHNMPVIRGTLDPTKTKFKVGDIVRVIKGRMVNEVGVITDAYPKMFHGGKWIPEFYYILTETNDEISFTTDELDLDSNYPPLPKKDYSYTEEMYLKDINNENTISDIYSVDIDPMVPISEMKKDFYKYYFNAQRRVKLKSFCNEVISGNCNISDFRNYSLPYVIATFEHIDDIIIMIHGWKDGVEPHFHFYKGYREGQFPTPATIRSGGAISLLYPCYYQHDGNHMEKLSKEDMDKIIEYFSKNNFSRWNYLLWEYKNESWNDHIMVPIKEKYKVPFEYYPMPNYRHDMPTIIERRIEDIIKE